MMKCFAILLSVLLALGACASGDPAPAESSSAATTEASAAPEPVTAKPGSLGEGYVRGASLDGSYIHVSDLIPGTVGRGCEGAGDYVLYRAPVDGGERSLATDDSGPARGDLIRGGTDNRVALIEGCEENATKAFVATESEDGRLSGIERVPVAERSIPRLTGWSNDGLYLLGVTDTAGEGPEPMQVIQLDPASGDTNTLFDSEPIFRVAQLKDGSYVTQGSGEIKVRNTTEVLRTYKGDFFQMSPAGDRFAVMGGGLSLVVGQGEAQTLVPASGESTIYSASFTTDGRTLAYVQVKNQGPKVEADLGIVATGGEAKIIESSGLKDQVSFGSPFFVAGGRFLAYNKTPDDGSNPPEVVLVEVPD